MNIVEAKPLIRFHGNIPEYRTRKQSLIDNLELTRVDRLHFAKTFLAETFWKDDDSQKKQIWELINDDTLPRVAVCGRRTLGKTSILQACAVAMICWRQLRFLLWCGSTWAKASEETENLKTLIVDNEKITDVFGDMLFQSAERTKKSVGRASWCLRDPFTKDPYSAVLPIGARQSPRGVGRIMGGRRVRVDGIFYDDIDNDEDATTKTRYNTLRWMNGAVAKTVDVDQQPARLGRCAGRWSRGTDPYWTPPWRMIALGNFIAEDAAIQHCVQDPRWVSIELPLAYEIGDDVYKSAIPDLFTDDDVRYRVDEEKRNPATWTEFCHDELLKEPKDIGKKYWLETEFQYYDDTEQSLSTRNDLVRVIIGDPTKTSKTTSDPAALLVIAIDIRKARIYIREYLEFRDSGAKPSPYTDSLIALAGRTNSWWFAVELLKQDEWIEEKIKECLAVRGCLRRVKWIDLNTSSSATGMHGYFGDGPLAIKKRRAAAGAQLYEPMLPSHPNGHVWHNHNLRNSSFESVLKKCPAVKIWCGTDCLGYIPQIQKIGGWYFTDQTPQTQAVISAKEFEDRWLREELEEQLMMCN